MKCIRLLLLAASCLALVTPTSQAEDLGLNDKVRLDIRPDDVIVWEAVQAVQSEDGRLLIGLRLSTKDRFTIYKDKLEFDGPLGYRIGIKSAPAARLQVDPMGEGQTEVYEAGDFEIELLGNERFRAKTIELSVRFLGCTQTICLWPHTKRLTIPVYASHTPPVDANIAEGLRDYSTREAPAAPSAELDTIGAGKDAAYLSTEEQYAERLKSGQLAWPLVLLVVFIGGIATNVTPCVFPMIPITLRLLAQQGQARFAASLAYALGIVVTYTGLGLVASLSGGVFGSILANPWVNVIFAVLFGILGITMLGFGNLSKLQSFGSQLGAGQGSLWNALGMGAGAGLVAAPCTGPIMGALLAYATTLNSLGQSVGLFFLYSLGFALPYLFLSSAAKRASSVKLSPKIQVSVKIIFAAAMFALALYYLKNPVHKSLETFRGHWQSGFYGLLLLSLPILISIVRSPKLIHQKALHLLPSILLGLALFAGVQWSTGNDLTVILKWHKDETQAYAEQTKTGKPILVDGWADWCVACKKMDQTTFLEPDVVELLQARWIILKLDMTEQNEKDEALAEKYGMQGLPTLVLIPADGDQTKIKKITGYVGRARLMEELRSFEGKN